MRSGAEPLANNASAAVLENCWPAARRATRISSFFTTRPLPTHNRPTEARYAVFDRTNAHMLPVQGVKAALGATRDRNEPRNFPPSDRSESRPPTAAHERAAVGGTSRAALRGYGGDVSR